GCSQGAQRAVFCAVRVADFLAEGGGWGASQGVAASWGARRCVRCKKIVRLHRFFLHQISLESKLNGRQKVKGGNGSISASISTSLIASLICLAHCLAHHPEPRSGLCPELLADFRNVPEKGCSFVISTPHFETRSPRLPSGKVNSQNYRTRAAFSRSETASTTLAFLDPFTVVWYPDVILISLAACFPAKFPSAPGMLGSSTWSTSDSV